MSKSIELAKGMTALVDDCDYEQVIRFRWSIHPHDATVYARAHVGVHQAYLHRFIMGTPRDPCRTIVDHINGRGYDCRRSNLRWVTIAENNRNRHQCEWPEVARCEDGWAYCIHDQKIGVFRTAFEAVLARDNTIRQLFAGELACRFPPMESADYTRMFEPLPHGPRPFQPDGNP
jgi:hypothetical protein